MHTLTVREIPSSVYDRLNARADAHRRSMSSEIVTILEEILLPIATEEDPFIKEAETFHARFPDNLPDLTSTGKRHGRKDGVHTR